MHTSMQMQDSKRDLKVKKCDHKGKGQFKKQREALFKAKRNFNLIIRIHTFDKTQNTTKTTKKMFFFFFS